MIYNIRTLILSEIIKMCLSANLEMCERSRIFNAFNSFCSSCRFFFMSMFLFRCLLTVHDIVELELCTSLNYIYKTRVVRLIIKLDELSNRRAKLRHNLCHLFPGLSLLLSYCDFVDVIEYIPSVRVTKKCHYYDSDENTSCTFGIWHPLAAEKLLTYHLNVVDDKTVFQNGYVKINGYSRLSCE